MPHNFADALNGAIRERKTCAIVGIDPVYPRLPAPLRQQGAPTVETAVESVGVFCRGVIDAVAPLVPAVKINIAFFEAFYAPGVELYYQIIEHAHQAGLLVIGDIKRGDIGSTARLYARAHLAAPAFANVSPQRIPDAVTLAGYLGENAVRPFIDVAREQGKGVFVLVRPSDPGADLVHEFNGGAASNAASPAADPPAAEPPAVHVRRSFYQHMAALVDEWGKDETLLGECGYSCVGAVVAAKDAAGTAALRKSLPRTLFLVPGYGAQGATAASIRPCFNPDGGAIVNASRSVIYAFDNDRCTKRFGDDWKAAIQQACRDFVADLSMLPRGAGQ